MIRAPRLLLPSFASLLAFAAACGGDEGRGSASTSLGSGGLSTTSATSATSATSTGGADSGTSAGSGASATEGGVKLDVGGDLDLPGATTGECVSSSLAPEVTSQPVDIIVVVDTSDSMGAAIAAVEASINVDFAAILEGGEVDYRLVVLGEWPTICVAAPLSATDCDPAPAVPAITERYKHYDAATGSGGFLAVILQWYSTPDVHGLAPGGYRDFLRPGARPVFLGMTDGESASNDTSLAAKWVSDVAALDPAYFGTADDPGFVFHLIVKMPVNDPADAPWLPADPIAGQGASLQKAAQLTGGWRFPLSQTADFDVLFSEIAKVVVDTTPIACEFPVPEAPRGETIDLDTVEIDYTPGGQGAPVAFHQVSGPGKCEAAAFYIDAGVVHLCPEACAVVQVDAMAKLDVRYGCDVGYVPG